MATRSRSKRNKRKEQQAAAVANQSTPLTYEQAKQIVNQHGIDAAKVTFGDHARMNNPRLSEAVTVVNMEEALAEMIGAGWIQVEGA